MVQSKLNYSQEQINLVGTLSNVGASAVLVADADIELILWVTSTPQGRGPVSLVACTMTPTARDQLRCWWVAVEGGVYLQRNAQAHSHHCREV